METILKEILRWVKQADKKIIIGISGHGAAGKTTFAKKLIHHVIVLNNLYLSLFQAHHDLIFS